MLIGKHKSRYRENKMCDAMQVGEGALIFLMREAISMTRNQSNRVE